MLNRQAAEAVRPNRREAARLASAAAILAVAMTAILAVDLSQRVTLTVGDLAPSDVRAPRAATFTNQLLTQQAQDAARAAVLPQYDYTSAKAIATSAEELTRFNQEVGPLDTAFGEKTSAADRTALIDAFLPKITADAGTVLRTLKPDRWDPVRQEAARVLDVVERTELRDDAVALARTQLREQMAGGLNEGERTLAASLIAPLLVPNSSFSQTLTDQERDRQAAAVAPVIDQIA